MADVLKYVIYIVVGMFVPLILVGNPASDLLRRRYWIAAAAGILAGLFTEFAARFTGLVGAGATAMGMSDSQPAFVLAAALGTTLYLLGNSFLGGSTRARSAKPGR